MKLKLSTLKQGIRIAIKDGFFYVSKTSRIEKQAGSWVHISLDQRISLTDKQAKKMITELIVAENAATS